jgi:uncharacterized membrane protein YjgN (DUF898 family)
MTTATVSAARLAAHSFVPPRVTHSFVPPSGVPVSFTGRAGEFFKMLLKGGLLQIPTFGFYRFWLITQVRQHLWANTRVGDEAFEYTGTAKEILIGFLIALAILVPIYIGYFVLGILAEEMQAFASLPLVLVLYGLAQYAAYRARSYRATRTTFRGLRFWMDGSGWAYAGKAALWDLATALTLGLAYPWRKAALERYLMQHTLFGSLRGNFVGTGGAFFKRAAWIWFLNVGIVALVAVTLGTSGREPGARMFVILLLLAIPFTLPMFLAIQARWQAEGVRFGSVGVVSTLKKGAFIGTFIKLVLSNIALLVGFMAFIAALSFPVVGDLQAFEQTGLTSQLSAFFVVAVLAYLGVIIGLGILQRYFMGRGLWAILAESLIVTNLSALDEVVAAGNPVSGLGEGLADAFDLGGV